MVNNQVTIQVVANVEDGEVQNLDQLIEDIKSEAVNVPVEVEDGEVLAADAEIDNLNQSVEVDIDVNDSAVQGAMQNIQNGINQAKQGLGEIASGMGETLSSAGRMEQTETFLSMNLGADKAKSKLEEIRSVTDKLPGDDVALQSLLSQSALKDTKLGAKEFEQMGGAAADYMAAMTNFGKSSTETQQDLMNYILQGNTAEIERSPVLQAHVDKLSEATTIQERSKALEEALNEEGWKGISRQDTYNNKLQTFSDLLERGKMNFGGMFLEGSKSIMSFLGDLDGATGGLIGLAAVIGTEFGPGIFSVVQGIFMMIPGIKALGGLSGIWGALSTGATGFAGSLAAVSIAGAPLWAVIAAIIALGVAVYEVGKYFGWWKDLPSMFGALKAGVMELWNAFINNQYVQQAIQLITQGLNDAWNAIVQFGQGIMSALGGEGGAGQFNILDQMVNNLNTSLSIVGPLIIAAINGIITYFRILYTGGQQVWTGLSIIINTSMATIRGIISGAMGIWSGLQSAWRTLQSTASSVFGAINGIVSSAGGVWQGFQSTVMGAIQPIIDKINDLKNAASGVGDLLHSVGLGGIETPVVSGAGGYGAGSTMVSQGNTIIFNMYGDIRDEKTLDDTIDAINSRIQFEALANGTTTTNNGGGI